ncbi:MAG: ATP-binding protein, partial [Dactylosporangium sp.]|nr:ATP-binding protein [Dactylosporangium sp.]NNJ62323.1 ATP-binding protein [Dactylosporangium sp.]
QGPPGHPDRGTRLAAQVAQARQRATTRWACPQPMPNAEVEPTRLHRSIDLLPAPYLRRRAEAMRLTRRGWLRVLRLAWTIADLAAHPRPDQTDVDEAIAWATATIGQP